MSLDSSKVHSILQRLCAVQPVKTWWLAYSGGVDSQVLLHLLSGLSLDLRAVYIDHGLQAASIQWAEHCRLSCQQLGIPFQVIRVDAGVKVGEGPEAAARKARYAALADLVEVGHCLLTAQHQDDQAETLLLQLLRGAGAPGLASMPLYSQFSRGWHMRPLLDFSRQDISRYAEAHGLTWVEDPSNQSSHYDRNYLRNDILPLLRQRWPAVDRTLATAASQQAENARLLNQLAEQDYQLIADEKAGLSVAALGVLDEPRLRNLLRHWIDKSRHPVPPRKVMQQIVQQMLSARPDAAPVVHWAETEVYRYRDRLYLSSARPHDDSQLLVWDGIQPLELVSLGQTLSFSRTAARGLRQDILSGPLQIRFRHGGERIKPCGRDAHHGLKKLFQEAGVPPRMRSRIPLIYCRGELVAVVGYWIADEFACAENETGLTPVLTGAD